MVQGKELLNEIEFNLTIRRLCQELLEKHDDFSDTCIIGIQPRGIALSERIKAGLVAEDPEIKFDYGVLDITFHRDDFRRHDKPLQPYKTDIEFITENKHVILIDDVLYSGRTIQAALAAVNHYGRPASIELLVLIDRRFNRHLPIHPDYTGLVVDAVDEAYVKVCWKDRCKAQNVMLYSAKN
jgi:pyrimidine operon attenuation protein/uracil phosphoribosyltransferase